MRTTHPAPEFDKVYGLFYYETRSLGRLNDNGFTFPEIADMLESGVPFTQFVNSDEDAQAFINGWRNNVPLR